MSSEEYKLLDTISSPRELKKLPPEELSAYCDELRRYIIDECAVNPGHLASSLGAVELAAALHYVFDTPEDRIVWDVGHQTYAHKIITGRREAFKTKRQLNGISGFPRMSESEYDSFGGGHASVSISAAFGMAKAAELRGEKRQVVAVIGDGSMTGGLAFEGLNNAGASKRTNLLVILNDNNMAIDQATGALKNYLLKISTSVHYNRFKQRLWGLMSHTPRLLRLCQKAGNAVKQGLLNKSNFFESLNFRYFGPVDGHNLKELVRTLRPAAGRTRRQACGRCGPKPPRQPPHPESKGRQQAIKWRFSLPGRFGKQSRRICAEKMRCGKFMRGYRAGRAECPPRRSRTGRTTARACRVRPIRRRCRAAAPARRSRGR